MKKKKIIAILLLTIIILSNIENPVHASENNVRIKVLSVKNNRQFVKVKVKIMNKTKRTISFGEKFSLYKRSNGKWEKIKWKDNYAFYDVKYILRKGKTAKRVFYVNKEALKEKLEKKKRYMIRFRISGKKKAVKFKLK